MASFRSPELRKSMPFCPGLYCSKVTNSGSEGRIAQNCRSRHARGNFFEEFQPFSNDAERPGSGASHSRQRMDGSARLCTRSHLAKNLIKKMSDVEVEKLSRSDGDLEMKILAYEACLRRQQRG